MSDIYEPWVPVLGQRVRVRISGECQFVADRSCNQDGHRWRRQGHSDAEDGRTGTVAPCGCRRIRPGGPSSTHHRFHVIYDEPMPWFDDYEQFTMHYAAIELEPAP